MLFKVCFIVILFFVYSFIGYIIEVGSIFFEQKKLCLSRGFYIGPYLPIFGFGALFILYPLSRYQNDILELYVFSVVLCGILEYFTSYIMEKQYGLRWWDYSEKKYNINGRICLENLLMFGIVAVILVTFFNPLLVNMINSLPRNVILIFGIVLIIIFAIDYIVSTYIAYNVKDSIVTKKNSDNTQDIKKEIKRLFKGENCFAKRLKKSFPHTVDYYKKTRQKINSYKDKTKN